MTTVPHGTTDDPGRWTPDLGVVPDRRFTWTGLGGATSAPERTGGAPGPEEVSVTWVWALLAVWLVGVPVAVVIGRSIRLADRADRDVDRAAAPVDVPSPRDDAGTA